MDWEAGITILIKINGFKWNERNEKHIMGRHNVTKSEAEEVFMGDPYFRIGRDGTRYVYGQTSAGRYLFIVYLYLENGLAWVITARDMTDGERKLYLRR